MTCELFLNYLSVFTLTTNGLSAQMLLCGICPQRTVFLVQLHHKYSILIW